MKLDVVLSVWIVLLIARRISAAMDNCDRVYWLKEGEHVQIGCDLECTHYCSVDRDGTDLSVSQYDVHYSDNSTMAEFGNYTAWCSDKMSQNKLVLPAGFNSSHIITLSMIKNISHVIIHYESPVSIAHVPHHCEIWVDGKPDHVFDEQNNVYFNHDQFKNLSMYEAKCFICKNSNTLDSLQKMGRDINVTANGCLPPDGVSMKCTNGSSELASVGEECSFTCPPGKGLVGSVNATATCSAPGRWSGGQQPLCIGLTCDGSIGVPSHATFQLPCDNTYKSHCIVKCDQGFSDGYTTYVCDKTKNGPKTLTWFPHDEVQLICNPTANLQPDVLSGDVHLNVHHSDDIKGFIVSTAVIALLVILLGMMALIAMRLYRRRRGNHVHTEEDDVISNSSAVQSSTDGLTADSNENLNDDPLPHTPHPVQDQDNSVYVYSVSSSSSR